MSNVTLLVWTLLSAPQDDQEFGRTMAERGYFDLAEEKLAQSGSKIDLLRLRLSRRPPLEDTLKIVEEIKTCPQSELLQAEAWQYVARLHAARGNRDAAGAAFDAAIAACQAMPRAQEPEIMLAQYNELLSRFARIATLRDDPRAARALEKDVQSFGLTYDGYLCLIDVLTQYGAAWLALAEAQTPAESRLLAERGLEWIRKADVKTLASDPKAKEYDELLFTNVRQHMALLNFLGNLKRPRNHKPSFLESTTLAAQAFSWYPAARATPAGAAVQIELAKAFLGLGETGKAMEIVRGLLKSPKLRWLVISSMPIFSTYLTAPERFELAQGLFDMNDFATAVRLYQEAAADPALAPRSWFKIGESYYVQGRYVEAVQAFDALLKLPDVEDSPRGASMMLRALRTLEKLTGRPSKEIELLQTLMQKKDWIDNEEKRNLAIELGRTKHYEEAVKAWESLTGENELLRYRLEALSQAGCARYWAARGNEAALRLAVRSFDRALALAKTQPKIPPGSVDDVLNALSLGGAAWGQLAKTPADADLMLAFLDRELLERCPNPRPDAAIGILGWRIEAHVRRGRPSEAEADFAALERIYQKTGAGLEGYKNAVHRLAGSMPDLEKSIPYLERVLELGGGKFETVKTTAVRAYELAERRGSPADYARARRLFEQFLGNFSRQIDDALSYNVRYRIARCYLGEKNPAKANAALDGLLRDEPNDLEVRELKGDTLCDMKSFGAAEAFYLEIIRTTRGRQRETYFRNIWKWGRACYETGPGMLRLAQYFSGRNEGPEWDGGPYKEKLNGLKKLVEEKIPVKGR